MNLPERRLLDAAPDSMVVVDVSGIIVLVNRQTESLFGYSREELIGQPVEILLPERFRNRHPQHRKLFRDSPRFRSMGQGLALFGRHKDGTEIPVAISLSPVETDEGPLVASAIRDMTAHIEGERALETAKEIAESATATKSRFLAAASHDLRQPLQSISLYLSVLDRMLANPKAQEIGGKIRVSLDVMGELLDALLDISKLDGGSITPTFRDTPVQEIFDRLISDCEPQALEKNLRLSCTKTDCVVHSDPGLLERILENFVTNGIRYTEEGEIRIHCDSSGNVARIAVSDTGVGIAKEYVDRVFEEYYQLDNPVRDRRKGLGLGLSIVKHIARLLDHPVEVSSVLGEGSTFSVEVPFGKPVEQRVEQPAKEKTPHRETREPVVLFVDDDPAIVDATTMLLQTAGIHVFSALDGDGGLAQIAAGIRPDIIVSDYRLPGYNGVELIRRVRDATNDDLPTVLMTGDTSAKEIEAANLENCTVLHKPVDTERLISLIESLAG